MGKIIISLLITALSLSGTLCLAQEKDRYYQGSVSIGYTGPLNFGLRTTHGVVYDRSNIFVGGEAWLRLGLEDGTTVKAGAVSRWSYVSLERVDAYIGMSAGLHVGRNRFTGTYGEMVNTFDTGAYLSPELGVGIGVGNGDYIDISLDFPLNFILYRKTRTEYIGGGSEETIGGGSLEIYNYPGISIGYRF